MQQLFAEGHGVIYQSVGTWLASKHTQLQLTGALAIANFARNGKNPHLLFCSTPTQSIEVKGQLRFSSDTASACGFCTL